MYAEVAVALPVDKTYLYMIPEALKDKIGKGYRVLVPFGRRKVTGYVMGFRKEPGDIAKLKNIEKVLDTMPMLTPTVLSLAQWSAEYYMAPPGEMLKTALPSGINRESALFVFPAETRTGASPLDDDEQKILDLVRNNKRMTLAALEKRCGDPSFPRKIRRLETEGLIVLRQELRENIVRDKFIHTVSLSPDHAAIDTFLRTGGKRLAAQIRVIEFLKLKKGPVPATYLLAVLGISASPVSALVRKGLLVKGKLREERAALPPLLSFALQEPHIPTADQKNALDMIHEKLDEKTFTPVLLHGVTGSGKTEVYLRAIEYCLSLGRNALYLVPEIGLTPVLQSLLRQRFGNAVGLFHSGLGSGERYDHWWRARRGMVRVVVGTRSAVFSPLENVGIIIVDEEQDLSFKQADRPNYHARDLAVMRGKLEDAVVIMGTATPSMETYTNTLSGKYLLLELPARISEQGLAEVRVIDMREAFKREKKEVLFSRELLEAIAARHQKGEQVILLLNKRGFSSFLLCRECVRPVSCPHCSVNLVFHYFHHRLICHHCGFSIAVPETCAQCGSPHLTKIGIGTEKIEQLTHDFFPDMKIWRMDRDSTSRRGMHDTILAHFGKGDADMLVGTQMVAKGHDFPNVTLVGVLNADLGLGIPDFRAPERTFQLLTQVAGRSGRGMKKGEVIIQTYYPDHFCIQRAKKQDFIAYYEEEIHFRRLMKLPPFYALANVIITGKNAEKVKKNAEKAARHLEAALSGDARMLGPAPAPLYRLRNIYRHQIILKDRSRLRLRSSLQKALQSLYASRYRQQDITIDIDPYHLM